MFGVAAASGTEPWPGLRHLSKRRSLAAKCGLMRGRDGWERWLQPREQAVTGLGES